MGQHQDLRVFGLLTGVVGEAEAKQREAEAVAAAGS